MRIAVLIRCWALVAMGAMAGMPTWAQSPSPAQQAASAAAAAAATVNQLPVIKGGLTLDAVRDKLGTYAPGTREGYFQGGQGSAVAPGTTRTLDCASRNDPECQAIQILQRGRTRATDIIPANAPSLANRDNLVGNPRAVLGFDPAEAAGAVSSVQCKSISTTIPEVRELTTCEVTIPADELKCSIGREVVVDADEVYKCLTRTASNVDSQCSVGRVIRVDATTTYRCVEQERAMNSTTCTIGQVVEVRSDTAYQCKVQQRTVGASACAIGEVVVVDPQFNYKCSATPYATTTQQCERTLTVTCAAPTDGCDVAGIVPGSTQADMAVTYGPTGSGNYGLTFGTFADNYWNDCENPVQRSLSFTVANKDQISTFQIERMAWDDYILLNLNGTNVFAGPDGGNTLVTMVTGTYSCGRFGESTCKTFGVCTSSNYPGLVGNFTNGGLPTDFVCYASNQQERLTSWDQTMSVDLRPFLNNGPNTINMSVLACGGGEGAVTIRARQFCPQNCTEEWNDSACRPYKDRQ